MLCSVLKVAAIRITEEKNHEAFKKCSAPEKKLQKNFTNTTNRKQSYRPKDQRRPMANILRKNISEQF